MEYYSFEFFYSLAKRYYDEFGNLNIPKDYSINQILIGEWVNSIKKSYSQDKLNPKEIELMEKIGIVWENSIHKEKKSLDIMYDKYYILAKTYYEKNGNLLISDNDSENEELMKFLKRVKKEYSLGKLSNERIYELEQIGMIWNLVEYNKSQRREKMFLIAKKYYETYGNLLPDLDFVYEGTNLGRFIINLRKEYKDGKLPVEFINKMNSIGMIWHINKSVDADEYFNYKFSLAREYFNMTGNTDFENSNINKYNYLKQWLLTIKRSYNNGELSEDKIELLKEISIFIEKNHCDAKLKAHQKSFKRNYEIAKKYYETYGNFLVKFHESFEGFNLGIWISQLRQDYHNGKLTDEEINALNEIKMVWYGKDALKQYKSI